MGNKISEYSRSDKNLYFEGNHVPYVMKSGKRNSGRIVGWDNGGLVILITPRGQEVRVPEDRILWDGLYEPAIIPIDEYRFDYIFHRGVRSRFKAANTRSVGVMTYVSQGGRHPAHDTIRQAGRQGTRQLDEWARNDFDYSDGLEALRLAVREQRTHGRYWVLSRHLAFIHHDTDRVYVFNRGVIIPFDQGRVAALEALEKMYDN